MPFAKLAPGFLRFHWEHGNRESAEGNPIVTEVSVGGQHQIGAQRSQASLPSAIACSWNPSPAHVVAGLLFRSAGVREPADVFDASSDVSCAPGAGPHRVPRWDSA